MTDQHPPPEHPSRSIAPRLPYRIRSAETWDLVRTHYLRGETARALSERYGVSVSNIRRRAGDEGWTRKGHAEAVDHFRPDGPPAPVSVSQAPPPRLSMGGFADPYPQGPEAETLDPLDSDPDEVKTLALAAVAKALRAGRYADAERLGRLAESLSRMAAAQGGPELTLDDFRTPNLIPRYDPADPSPQAEEWTPELLAVRDEAEKRFTDLADRLEEQGLLDRVLAVDTEAQDQEQAEAAYANYLKTRKR